MADEQAAGAAAPRVDAMLIPEGLKSGDTQDERLDSIAEIARPHLGSPMCIRSRMPGGKVFVTAHPYDTLFMPSWHPRAGLDRYRWTDRGDGVMLGVLVDGAPTGDQIEARNRSHFGI